MPESRTTTRRSALAFAAMLVAAGSPLPAAAEEKVPPTAWTMRLSIFQGERIMAFATWIAYEGQESTLTQRGGTPYPAAIALTPKGEAKAKEGRTTTEFDLKARPFRHRGGLVLNVDLNFQYHPHMNRYRSEDLLEELPTNGGFASGGDFVGERIGKGWKFPLTWRDGDEWRAEILAEPVEIVDRDR